MNTLLENIRASAILMKNLPSTILGDALLISREEARRIGHELEACAERIWQNAPQGADEWIELHAFETESNGWSSNRCVVPVARLRAYLSGMALVPVELLKEWAHDLDAEINARDIAEQMQAIIDGKPCSQS